MIEDFNVHLGGDRRRLERAIGSFASTDHLSDNGNRLASFCDHNDLCIGNTYFRHRRIHKKTWRAHDGTLFKEINHVCIRHRWRTSLHEAQVYRAADVGSDLYQVITIVRANLKLKLKRQRQSVTMWPYAIEKLKDPAVYNSFAKELQNRFELHVRLPTVEENWTTVKTTIHNCAEVEMGRQRGKRWEAWIKPGHGHERTSNVNERRTVIPI